MGSALDGTVFDFTQILAYLVHIKSRSQFYLGFGHFDCMTRVFWSVAWFLVCSVLTSLWSNCLSPVEISLFLWADILLQYQTLFQCYGLVKWFQIHHVNWFKVFFSNDMSAKWVPSLFCVSFFYFFFLRLIATWKLCVVWLCEEG